MQTIASGFLLLKPAPRTDWFSQELLPERIISAADCICPQFPGSYVLSWCGDTPEQRAEAFDEIGLAPEHRDAATEWATAAFDEAFGWPGVFFTLEAALEARSRFFPQSDLVVVGLGLPVQYRDAFVTALTPPPQQPGFAPNGESGYLRVTLTDTPLPDGGVLLGFEPLNVTLWQIAHSWLCNQLERDFSETLGIVPGETGLLESFADAARCCQAIERGDIGAEPGPWYPMLLVEYGREQPNDG